MGDDRKRFDEGMGLSKYWRGGEPSNAVNQVVLFSDRNYLISMRNRWFLLFVCLIALICNFDIDFFFFLIAQGIDILFGKLFTSNVEGSYRTRFAIWLQIFLVATKRNFSINRSNGST